MSPTSGGVRCSDAAKRTAAHGSGSRSWPTTGSRNPASFILGRANASPSNTQGGSRMPELGPYGSVRGALSNERPYRDQHLRSRPQLENRVLRRRAVHPISFPRSPDPNQSVLCFLATHLCVTLGY